MRCVTHSLISVFMAGTALSALALPASGQSVEEPVQGEAVVEDAVSATVVVIGRRANLMRIPGSGATIEGADLDRAHPLSVSEALRRVAGVYPRDEEGMGMRPNIGVRGLSPVRSTKVLLLEDGIPLSFAPYGDNATYYHPPLDRFRRIEVLKGASQVRFGPQTIGGVVNYITPSAPDEFEARLKLATGNNGYGEIDASIGGPLLGWNMLLHGNATSSDGARENLDLSFTDLFFKAERDLGDGHNIVFRASRFAEDSQVTYSGLTLAEWQANPRGNVFRNDEFESERIGLALSHGYEFGEASRLVTTAYYSGFDRDWWRQSSNSGQRPNDSSDPACGGMANLNTTCGNEGRLRSYATFGIETRLTTEWMWGDVAATGEFGLRWHHERQARLQWNGDAPDSRRPGTGVNAGVREDNLRETEALSGFATIRFAWERLGVEPGVRVELIDYFRRNNLTGLEGETDLAEIIPGIGFTYELADDVVAYAGVHRGFAPPRVEDIITNTGGSVDLDAEESTNWELGMRGDVADGLSGDVTFFRLDFENQTIPSSVAGGTGSVLTSAGETLHEGLEFSVNGSLADAGLMESGDIFARASVTWLWEASFQGTRFSNVSGFGGVSVSGNRLPYAPEWLASAALGYDHDGIFNTEIEMVYTGGMFTDDLNTVPVSANGQRGRIKSSVVWNASVNWHVVERDDGSSVTLFAAAKNLFDELYVADRTRGTIPGTPQLFQVGVILSY